MMAICPATNWLRAKLEIEQPHAQRRQHEQRRGGGEDPHRSFERHAEHEHRERYRSRHAAHAEQEIGDQLGEQDLPHRHAGDHQRFHRAALPLPRDHQRGQQRAGERHDHRDQAGHQVVAAADGRVEAHLRLHRERQRRRPSRRGGAVRSASWPRAAARSLRSGARRWHPRRSRSRRSARCPGFARSAGEIASQPDDALDLARRHGRLGVLDRQEPARAEDTGSARTWR